MSLKKTVSNNMWILVLVALGIGGFLLYKYVQANKLPETSAE